MAVRVGPGKGPNIEPGMGANIGRTSDAHAAAPTTVATANRIGSVQCPILVGRDELLELADRRLADAAAGRGELLLLAGQAGIGKSRLLGSIRRKARAAGFLVANGSVAPQDQFLPAALIMELARTLARTAGAEALGIELVAMTPDTEGDSLMRRRRYVHDIVDRILRAIERPTMLDFEDLQWADEVSLEIVGELARKADDRPLLLVGAYRYEELPPGAFFREWRARLISQRLAEEARLAPLTAEQTALMTTLILDTGLPAPREVAAAVYERTDGIPLHVEEMLAALPPHARTDGRAIRQAQVPDTIEDAILARLEQLSPEAREVARAGSVIGRCFVPSVLAGMMDRQLADLDRPLRELQDRAFLYTADPGYLDYRHQLLRDVLYRTVPADELRKLHARAAEFGAELSGQSDIHASAHYERAGLRAQAYRAALAGAQAASRMSGRQEAFELYRRAIENMPADLPLLEQAQLYEGYSEAAGSIERNETCTEAAVIARDRYLAAGRPIEAAGMLYQSTILMARNGEPHAPQLEAMNQALAELEAVPPSHERDELRALLLSGRADLALLASRLPDARRDADAARRLADAIGAQETLLDTDLLIARIDIVAGRVEQGFADGLRAARAARDAGYESVGVTGYRNLAILAARVFDEATAEASLQEGLEYADAIEQSHCRQMMATTRAILEWQAGRWDRAEDVARQELVERGCRRGIMGCLDVLGLVAMGRGRLDEARGWLDESLASGRRVGEPPFMLPPLWVLAEVDLLEGDPHRSLARCDEALALSIETGERALLVPFVVTGVRSALAARRPDEGGRWLSQVSEQLRGWPTADAALAHGDGLLRLASGSVSAARAALEIALRGWEERGRTWEAAWARLDLAGCLTRLGRNPDAGALVASVIETAERLDSPPLLARATELGRIVRSRGAEEEPWRPLTTREYDVARLIAKGLTNAEIAEALSIAPKTASSHVEHILAKLGLSRRAEVAAWVTSVGGAATARGGSAVGAR